MKKKPEGYKRAIRVNREDKEDHGHLLIDGPVVTANPIKGAESGNCPACQTKASPWEAPKDDPGFERAIRKLSGDNEIPREELYKKFLIKMGGYITTCSCGVSFFVRVSE